MSARLSLNPSSTTPIRSSRRDDVASPGCTAFRTRVDHGSAEKAIPSTTHAVRVGTNGTPTWMALAAANPTSASPRPGSRARAESVEVKAELAQQGAQALLIGSRQPVEQL